ncbi:MAG TPA: AAA family ATPase [Candidatus Limnocylindrales bacterium]
MTALVGRDRELADVRRFLGELDGPASHLAIRGEAGIGKTTLFQHVVGAAQEAGWTLLVARPAEAERALPFAALQDLLEGVADDAIAGLPEPQRRALAAIQLRESAPRGGLDARTVGTAVLNTLRALEAIGPTLVAIDDVQWLDPGSRDALGFALRRVHRRVRIITGERIDERGGGSALDLAPVPIDLLLLPGLSVAGLYHVLREQLQHAFPRPALVRIGSWSGGNPMLALEIGRLLVGRSDAPLDEMPLSPRLGSLVGARLRTLPLAVRRTLLVIALAGSIDESSLDGLMRRLGWRVRFPEVDQGILGPGRGPLRFGHPVLEATAVMTVPAADRRRVHAELAAATPDPVARARHIALATGGRQEEVAAAAEAAAQSAEQLGATETALELAELAVARTPVAGTDAMQRRWLGLGRVALRAGDADRAAAAFANAMDGPSSEVAVLAMVDAIEVEARRSTDQALALARLARVRSSGDRVLLARVALAMPGSARDRYRHARAAIRLLGAIGPAELRARAIASKAAAALEAGGLVRLEELDLAVQLESTAPLREVAASAAFLRSWVLFFEDDLVRSRHEFEELHAQALAIGDERSIAAILRELTHIEIRAGRWTEAERLATAGLRAAEQGGELAGEAMAHLQLGAVAALRGRGVDADRELGLAESLGAASGLRRAVGLAIGRRGQLHLVLGELDAAVTAFERSSEVLLEAGATEPALTNWRGEHAEALVRLDRLDEAEALVDRLESGIGASHRPVSRAIVERTRALIAAERGDMDAAVVLAATSVERLRFLQEPFELARALEVAGAVHRRARHKTEAAALLGEAASTFDALGAVDWAARARSELARVGLRPRASSSLTDTELAVARLAAAGHTNREVARRTFMSPKTVEAVLARAYGKLGIASRAELGGILGTSAPTDAGATARAHPD